MLPLVAAWQAVLPALVGRNVENRRVVLPVQSGVPNSKTAYKAADIFGVDTLAGALGGKAMSTLAGGRARRRRQPLRTGDDHSLSFVVKYSVAFFQELLEWLAALQYFLVKS